MRRHPPRYPRPNKELHPALDLLGRIACLIVMLAVALLFLVVGGE